MLWDLAEGKRLYSLDAGDIINALVFSPNRYWLCAATQVGGVWAGTGTHACAHAWSWHPIATVVLFLTPLWATHL